MELGSQRRRKGGREGWTVILPGSCLFIISHSQKRVEQSGMGGREGQARRGQAWRGAGQFKLMAGAGATGFAASIFMADQFSNNHAAQTCRDKH